MSLLLFDVGNSRCKWAWLVNGLSVRQGVIDNTDTEAWACLKKEFSVLDAPGKILASNVAGAGYAEKLFDLVLVWARPVQLIVAQPLQCGVKNLYQHPAQLGSDRWAALIAAWQTIRGACLVVNCGTATTVDALSEKGEFLGGMILPGIKLMQDSLSYNTAQLGYDAGTLRDFPQNTPDAILSGVLRATLGVIQHQYSLLASRCITRCIISGGAGKVLLPHLGAECVYMDNLVLQGLQIIAQECMTNTENGTVAT